MIQNHQQNSKKTKIFSIVNQKGGVGKTTTAINIATAIASVKKKVLLIDLDPQGNASTGLGIENDVRVTTIYDVIIGQSTASNAILNTKIPNLKIITSTVDLSACEVELVGIENREYLLKNSLVEIIYDFDAIIIDCPPSLGLLTINALSSSDAILIPMQCEFFSLEGLSHLLNTVGLVKENLNPDLRVSGIILTMHDRRNKLTEQVENDVRSFLGDKVYENYVPRNVRLSEAPSYGLPGVIYDSKSSGSLAYIKLAREIIIRESI
ncbi:MAG: ParA family protein [Alphaproteobacteria bacterium]|nr:ParA family protein [Alphaproteobacteria bacterium]